MSMILENTSQEDPGLFKVFQSVKLFSSLIDEDIRFLITKSAAKNVLSGETIFRTDELASQFFIVLSGKVGIFRTGAKGKELFFAQFIAGEVFGDLDFITQTHFNARAQALEDSTLLCIPCDKSNLDTLAQEAPKTISRLLIQSLAIMSSRLRATQHLISEKTPWSEELRHQIYCDPPTGLWNRAYLDEEIPRFLVKPAALILMKPENFKLLNDTRGHQAGDQAMAKIAQLLFREVSERELAWAIRIKSNETALVLSKTSEEGARDCIQRLRKKLEDITFAEENGLPVFSLTGSFSYAIWPDDGLEWRTMVKKTAKLLLLAWSKGSQKVYRLKRLKNNV